MSDERQGLFVPLTTEAIRHLDAIAVASNRPDAAHIVAQLVNVYLYGHMALRSKPARKADE